MPDFSNPRIRKLSVVLIAGALLLPWVSACKPGTATSLAGIVEDMAGRAGSDQISRLHVERAPDQGLHVTAAFVHADGTAVEYRKLPIEDLPVSLGSPTPRVVSSGMPVDELDLPAVERRLDEVPDCSDPRADISVFGEHVATNFRCGYDGPPTGHLDGADVPKIPAGDFETAAAQLRDDLGLLGTTEIASAAIGMTSGEVWTRLHSTQPELPVSDGKNCPLLMIRSGGGFVTRCESTEAHHTARALDPAAMTKIWQAEGEPARGWLLELVVREDDAHWRTTKGKESRMYSLDGEPQ